METEEKFFWGALIGCAIGAGAALMLTPFSGVSLRRRIVNGLNHAPGELADKLAHRSSHVRIPRQRQSLNRESHAAHVSQVNRASHTSHARRAAAPNKSASSEKPLHEKDGKRSSHPKMSKTREHSALKTHHHK